MCPAMCAVGSVHPGVGGEETLTGRVGAWGFGFGARSLAHCTLAKCQHLLYFYATQNLRRERYCVMSKGEIYLQIRPRSSVATSARHACHSILFLLFILSLIQSRFFSLHSSETKCRRGIHFGRRLGKPTLVTHSTDLRRFMESHEATIPTLVWTYEARCSQSYTCAMSSTCYSIRLYSGMLQWLQTGQKIAVNRE